MSVHRLIVGLIKSGVIATNFHSKHVDSITRLNIESELQLSKCRD